MSVGQTPGLAHWCACNCVIDIYVYIYIIYSISTYYTFAGRLAAETLGTFKPPFPNHRFDWSKGNYLLGNHPIYDVKSFHDPHYIYYIY